MEKTTVQMRLTDVDLDRIENIKNLTGETNRTKIVKAGIELLDMVTNANKTGKKVFIQEKNGAIEVIKVIGV